MVKEVQILREYQDTLDSMYSSRVSLRFGRHSVGISAMAQQFYCEKALHLSYEYPIEPSYSMVEGKKGHENAIYGIKSVSNEMAIKYASRFRNPICIYEFGVGWKYKDVPIVGRIDEVWFRQGSVELVGERKFTYNLRPNRKFHIQAKLYCLGLAEMGFDTSSTKYKITLFRMSCFDCQRLASRICPVLTSDDTHVSCNLGEAKSFTYSFQKDDIIAELDWALEYWLSNREAEDTSDGVKCRTCQYQEIC